MDGGERTIMYLNIFTSEAKTEKDKCRKKHLLGIHHMWHCILQPLWLKVLGSCDDATTSQHVRHAAAVTSQSFQSANWCFTSPQAHPRRHSKWTPNSSPVHLSIQTLSPWANALGASNPPGHVTDVQLERLQYASQTLDRQDANCE